MHLLTGATGYIGGRLLRRLESSGAPVRCLCRNPEALDGRVLPSTELVRGTLLQPASLGGVFAGVDTAFYLVHSMNGGEAFEAEERTAASNFAMAARQDGVRRIIYLGGLGHGEALSPHMRSRVETGNILRASGVQVIELQASIVIGSGSASFEVIRALVERLPAMITPRWVNTAAQPIAIEDVIEYLAAMAAGLRVTGNLTFEIGGADVISYVGIIREIRTATQLTAMDFAGAVPQPVIIQSVVDIDYAGLRRDWALSHRECPKSERRAKSGGAGSVSHSTDGDPASDRARFGK